MMRREKKQGWEEEEEDEGAPSLIETRIMGARHGSPRPPLCSVLLLSTALTWCEDKISLENLE